ncbi:MAG: pilus (MSHA type) biogenesis protein MshL [Thermodesulfobacteriota bacterium]|nr:pilus (MSHA type) biogenesis protein MshL [Thermodesulfobacteriota bacterium]
MARKTSLMNHALIFIMLPAILSGCALVSAPPAGDNAGRRPPGQETPAALEQTEFRQRTAFNNDNKDQLPVQYQKPAYAVKSLDADDAGLDDKEPVLVVGATISTTTRLVPLRDILKRLAALKDMNIGWSSDVDQYVPVDVNIRAEDDFYKAIENLLRQVDYFYEIQGNTIVVKYKETRKFHIAMPFLSSAYAYGVGGDVLGGGESTNMSGTMQITSDGNTFDIWDNITSNLDKVLEIWTSESGTTIQMGPEESSEGESSESTTETPTTYTRASAQGYYTIDKPIGMITVTAPQTLLEKIAVYLDNLKAELYRQISIEAKIIEVTLNNAENRGIDWSGLLNDFNLNFTMAFGQNGQIWPDSGGILQTFSMDATKNFSIIIDALDTQGVVNVLANPRINVMNGQPALISVGENTRFIDQVTTTIDEGIISYSVTTATVMSGLGMSVVAIILEDDEIVLTMTPVTTQLEKPVEYRDFGASTVGLPVINVREMSTTVRIKNGEMLVIGGLIDSINSDSETKVPVLGSMPLINKLFNNTSKQEMKTELVILLRPQIIL